ncbi:beta-ketoacyl-[acyl-carrier-protein] synthase family protein [Serratia fonticola]|uniref:beta-ketoacyl-[acyl-carrier-protein] synthase family protein n=1 Tax=Serratia fonticola TaxID=47917 RepID=UPI000FA7D093|nr:beta-ketoacyl-[acyl-carrier-protein] synthase family protein [Serratia fonticola]CAI2026820.1 3-oxoacyl-[acyl-carrier-protein] synthase 2 [Serratia fonticola]
MKNKVMVSGIGILSSSGRTPEECWSSLIQKHCSTNHDERIKNAAISICNPITGFNPDKHLKKSLIWRTDPFIHYALYAANEAIKDSGIILSQENERIGIVLGNSLGGITTIEHLTERASKEGLGTIGSAYILSTMASMAVGNIAIELGITGPTYTIGTACASGTDAIGVAKGLIESGECSVVLAGASEAPITSMVVSAFSRIGALSKNVDPKTASRPFDVNRDGFVISEGAAVVVLESEEHALQRNASIYAQVTGYGSANDANHVTSPANDGFGLRNSITAALVDASLTAGQIDCINAHGTSTPLNDQIEGQVLASVFGNSTYVTSTKGVTGHCLAASGALEAVFSILKIRHQRIPPVAGLKVIDPNINLKIPMDVVNDKCIQHVLSNSIGFGGQNASIIFSQYH